MDLKWPWASRSSVKRLIKQLATSFTWKGKKKTEWNLGWLDTNQTQDLSHTNIVKFEDYELLKE